MSTLELFSSFLELSIEILDEFERHSRFERDVSHCLGWGVMRCIVRSLMHTYV